MIPSHANVIKNYVNIEIFSADDRNNSDCLGWITLMEPCDIDLRTELRKEELTLEIRKQIALGLKSGLEYLENIGIYHDDLKPKNILLKDRSPRIIDFGIIMDKSFREGYRELGYTRRGTKFLHSPYLCIVICVLNRDSQHYLRFWVSCFL
jgi:serine/threonine protein kinase